jgi:dienelactone hydrolase
MRARYLIPLLALCVLSVGRSARAETEAHAVEYRDGDTVLEGFLATPAANGKRPGILIVHQWKGLGDFERKKAKDLAALGYVALAVDIYGKGVRPKTPQEAGAQSGKYKGQRALYRQRLLAGLERLKKEKRVDPERIGAIGFCFGGTGVLELARSGADVAGVVSFHGGLDSPTPKDATQIKGKVLVLHGANDPLVPDTQLLAFMKEMRDAKVDWQLVAYGGAVHAFTDPGADKYNSPAVGYHAKADRRSWLAMRNFFDEAFSG